MRVFGEENGQMTLELIVALPVAIAIALVAYNALAFFSECASFDRAARNAVRVHATSPAYGQDTPSGLAAIERSVSEAISGEGLACSVSMSRSGGLERYEVVLEYQPTLFGVSLKSDVFGVRLFTLKHKTSLVVDPYDAGVLI